MVLGTDAATAMEERCAQKPGHGPWSDGLTAIQFECDSMRLVVFVFVFVSARVAFVSWWADSLMCKHPPPVAFAFCEPQRYVCARAAS